MAERLTEPIITGKYYTYDPIDIYENDYSKANFQKIVDRLGRYEDLEEKISKLFDGKLTLEDVVANIQKTISGEEEFEFARVLTNAEAEKWDRWKSLEEQHRLIELPCAVGDTVWGIRSYKGIKYAQQGFVSDMFYNQNMELMIVIKHICRGCWGKKVFGTQEAAEAALKEREEK